MLIQNIDIQTVKALENKFPRLNEANELPIAERLQKIAKYRCYDSKSKDLTECKNIYKFAPSWKNLTSLKTVLKGQEVEDWDSIFEYTPNLKSFAIGCGWEVRKTQIKPLIESLRKN